MGNPAKLDSVVYRFHHYHLPELQEALLETIHNLLGKRGFYCASAKGLRRIVAPLVRGTARPQKVEKSLSALRSAGRLDKVGTLFRINKYTVAKPMPVPDGCCALIQIPLAIALDKSRSPNEKKLAGRVHWKTLIADNREPYLTATDVEFAKVMNWDVAKFRRTLSKLTKGERPLLQIKGNTHNRVITMHPKWKEHCRGDLVAGFNQEWAEYVEKRDADWKKTKQEMNRRNTPLSVHNMGGDTPLSVHNMEGNTPLSVHNVDPNSLELRGNRACDKIKERDKIRKGGQPCLPNENQQTQTSPVSGQPPPEFVQMLKSALQNLDGLSGDSLQMLKTANSEKNWTEAAEWVLAEYHACKSSLTPSCRNTRTFINKCLCSYLEADSGIATFHLGWLCTQKGRRAMNGFRTYLVKQDLMRATSAKRRHATFRHMGEEIQQQPESTGRPPRPEHVEKMPEDHSPWDQEIWKRRHQPKNTTSAEPETDWEEEQLLKEIANEP